MYIDPQIKIAGIPSLRLRSFFRRNAAEHWNTRFLAERLGLSPHAATRAARELVRLGYVQRSTTRLGGSTCYHLTLAGGSVALASAARPLTRSTAERRVREFLDRVRTINASDYYLFYVRKVIVFGSYLAGSGRINDVDLAVELVRRDADPVKRRRRHDARVRAARLSGRRFRNIVEEVDWPRAEVLRALKARSRAISLHTTDDGILDLVQTRTLFKAASITK